MNKKCVGTIEKISQTFDSLSEALDQLKEAIESDDEDMVQEALDEFPTPRGLASALEKLGHLIEDRPWAKK